MHHSPNITYTILYVSKLTMTPLRRRPVSTRAGQFTPLCRFEHCPYEVFASH